MTLMLGFHVQLKYASMQNNHTNYESKLLKLTSIPCVQTRCMPVSMVQNKNKNPLYAVFG